MFDLSNRVAVVCGASSGLGVQFAHALSGQGAKVALLARRAEKLEKIASELGAKGCEVLAVPCDITNENEVKKAVDAVMGRFGRVDILVNNAGRNKRVPFENFSTEDWNAVMDLNINAMMLCCREFGRQMLAGGYGRIINIASMFGLVTNSIAPAAAYQASKGAVVNFTRALAGEWAKRGITVNAICPGYFITELTEQFLSQPGPREGVKTYCPMGRVGQPGELNGALIYLASDEASYTTGSMLCVDGGWTAI